MFFYNESTEEVSQIVLPTSWTETGTKLSASDAAIEDNFGRAVSLTADGSLLAVGAFLEDPSGVTNAGSVYIFQNNNGSWEELTKLTASDKASNDYFGIGVSFTADGSLLAVGAYGEEPSGINDAGSVYIFQNNNDGTWTELIKLTASDKASGDAFGTSVSFTADGSLLAVGAYGEDPSGIAYAGSVYVFQNNNGTWTELTKLTASDKASNDYFGTAVSFTADGSLLAVGANGEDPSGVTNAGSVYIFQNNNGTWTELVKLTASDKASNDYFGTSASFTADGSLLAVGAQIEDPSGATYAGSVYILQNNNGTWTELIKLTASDKASNDYFGIGVSFTADGSLLAVGAQGEDPNGISNAGSVYIFQGI